MVEVFWGKTITLKTDVNLNGSSFCIGGTFAGTFDGGGHVISNILVDDYFLLSQYTINGSLNDGHFMGFFQRLSGTVINLGINNISFSYSNDDFALLLITDYVIIGGLVGYAEDNALIQNCKVENVSLTKAERIGPGKASPRLCGLIGGCKNAIIENCYTSNVSSSLDYGTTYAFGPCGKVFTGGYEATSGYYVVFDASGMKIDDCFVKQTDVSAFSWYDGKTSTEEDASNIEIHTDATSAASNLTEISHDGGIYEDKKVVWYHASDYNDGWPLLRIFMKDEDWKEVTITAYPSDYAEPQSQTQTIQIPSDASNTYTGKNGIEGKIIIYDQEVIVKAKEGYKVTSWTCNSAVSYVAKLEEIEYTLAFQYYQHTDNTTLKPILETTKAEEDYGLHYTFWDEIDQLVVFVRHGETIITEKDNKNNSYSYIITHKDGTETKITYNLTDYSEYTIDSFDMPEGAEESWIIVNEKLFNPTFKMKEYGWIFV